MRTPRVKATAKKLRQLARDCGEEAALCEAAARLVVADDGLHMKNAKAWHGRQRTCWHAIQLIEEMSQ